MLNLSKIIQFKYIFPHKLIVTYLDIKETVWSLLYMLFRLHAYREINYTACFYVQQCLRTIFEILCILKVYVCNIKLW